MKFHFKCLNASYQWFSGVTVIPDSISNNKIRMKDIYISKNRHISFEQTFDLSRITNNWCGDHFIR